MSDKPLVVLSISDIHLGHKRCYTYDIVERLAKYFLPEVAKADIVFLGGDILDTLLQFSEESHMVIAFIIAFMKICHDNKVTVRLLRGTFLHDRHQLKAFGIIYLENKYTNDFKYVDTLSVEYIKKHNLKVLYAPDNLPYKSSDKVLDVIQEHLLNNRWKTVDYAVIHGAFEHTLPPNMKHKPGCTYTISQFKAIVKRYVLVGHIHQTGTRELIINNGSFDRLTHGDEGRKGYYKIEDYKTKAYVTFIENKDATKFVTIDISKYQDQEKAISKYLEKLAKIFPSAQSYGYIRIVHNSVEIKTACLRLTAASYPNLVITHKSSHTDNPIKIAKVLDVKSHPVPTEDSLPEMVREQLSMKGVSVDLDRLKTILSENLVK